MSEVKTVVSFFVCVHVGLFLILIFCWDYSLLGLRIVNLLLQLVPICTQATQHAAKQVNTARGPMEDGLV